MKFARISALGFAAFTALVTSSAAPSIAAGADQGVLHMISIDVDGGGGTLFVTPEGKSLLIDTGWPAATAARTGGETSAQRIAAAAASLGITRLDYVIITHYHIDHLGGVVDLLAELPVGTFIDHGVNRELPPPLNPNAPPNATPGRGAGNSTQANYEKYVALLAGHGHIIAKPGDKLRIGSMTVTFVTADQQVIAKPLLGAGKPNPACQGIGTMDADGGIENAESVGSIITFGKVKIAALGDLSWNMEGKLFCPVDRVGPVDILVVTQHGSNLSSNPASVAALRPIVAVMGNGATKGGDPEPIKTVGASPRLQGFWRLHSSERHPDTDGPADYVANLTSRPDEGHAIRLRITTTGAIVVTNDRNDFSKIYQVK
jgi:competence protein ComEC